MLHSNGSTSAMCLKGTSGPFPQSSTFDLSLKGLRMFHLPVLRSDTRSLCTVFQQLTAFYGQAHGSYDEAHAFQRPNICHSFNRISGLTPFCSFIGCLYGLVYGSWCSGLVTMQKQGFGPLCMTPSCELHVLDHKRLASIPCFRVKRNC